MSHNSHASSLHPPQSGGSAASDRVVGFANSGKASLEDYKLKADLPTMDDIVSYPDLYQTAGASKRKGSKRKSSSRKKSGTKRKSGSKRKSGTKKVSSKRKTGGKKKINLNKKKKSSKKSIVKRLVKKTKPSLKKKRKVGPSRTLKTKRSKRTGQRGGSGFLSMAGCGPVNYPDAGRKYSGLFSSSTCPGPDFYRNPPGLEKAGSGSGSLGGPGAPYPFK